MTTELFVLLAVVIKAFGRLLQLLECMDFKGTECLWLAVSSVHLLLEKRACCCLNSLLKTKLLFFPKTGFNCWWWFINISFIFSGCNLISVLHMVPVISNSLHAHQSLGTDHSIELLVGNHGKIGLDPECWLNSSPLKSVLKFSRDLMCSTEFSGV